MKKIIFLIMCLMGAELSAHSYIGEGVYMLYEVQIEENILSATTDLDEGDIDPFWNHDYTLTQHRDYFILKSSEVKDLFYAFMSDDYLTIYRANSTEPVYVGTKNFSPESFIDVSAIQASSELVENGKKYSAANIQNFNADESWVEGKKGDGIGEYIMFSTQTPLLIVVNGFLSSRNPDLFYYNSRIKKARFTELQSGKSLVVELKDSMILQDIDLSELFSASQKNPSHEIKMEILEVYKGEKYDDTCLSTIWCNWIPMLKAID